AKSPDQGAKLSPVLGHQEPAEPLFEAQLFATRQPETRGQEPDELVEDPFDAAWIEHDPRPLQHQLDGFQLLCLVLAGLMQTEARAIVEFTDEGPQLLPLDGVYGVGELEDLLDVALGIETH